MSAFEMPGYGTPQELAEHFNTSPWVIRQRVKDGTLRAFRLGPRTLRINWESAKAAFGEGQS